MNTGTPREVDTICYILKARKSLRLSLTQRQKEILIGTILGDAYIYKMGKIQVEQSVKQKEYLFWKYQELKTLAYHSLPKRVDRYDRRTGKTYGSYRFWLRQYFRKWRDLFYEGTLKVFPPTLRLTPLSLAVWYMDDGSYSESMCTFSTESFSPNSLKCIQSALLRQFGLRTFMRSNGKIAIHTHDHNTFFRIIRENIHESMRYKIGLTL